VLNFLYTAVSWVLLRWHQLFTALGLDAAGGANWALSIVFLVVTARVLLFRLFIKQVKYQRHMQQMQPKIQALREKYKGDRAEMQRQMMALQQEQGFNPLAGCLPMFLQIPIFIALYHVLRHIANSQVLSPNAFTNPNSPAHHLTTLYSFTSEQTRDAANARLFGGAPLAGRLLDSATQIATLHGTLGTTRIVILFLVIISAAATYTTQRLARAGMATQPEGTAATVQRAMLYMIPIFTLGSGLFFPLGVLLYWFTSNTWTMLQQLYINKYHPHTPTKTVETGTVGKTLRPQAGQRPVRDARGKIDPTKQPDRRRAASGSTSKSEAAEPAEPNEPVASGEASVRSSVPRPGQRPNRPSGGKRPPGKKKRR
jgi:YidC/Oxa1 family membrane protein insertase